MHGEPSHPGNTWTLLRWSVACYEDIRRHLTAPRLTLPAEPCPRHWPSHPGPDTHRDLARDYNRAGDTTPTNRRSSSPIDTPRLICVPDMNPELPALSGQPASAIASESP